ncbi:MAG: hypothetical protein QM784_38955 [Polyangiaceae bacterium]
MTYSVELQVEEPVRANPNIDAVDEDSLRITLSDFSVEGVSRYSFLWPQRSEVFASQCIDALDAISEVSPKPAKCVSGWMHDIDGVLRMRHKVLISNLKKLDWIVAAERDLGIALKLANRGTLRSLIEPLLMPGIGWFLAFGDWCEPQVLTLPPFLATMKSFCCNRRLAPSRRFLEGLADRSGAVAYVNSSDDRRPSVVVATSKRMDNEALKLVDTWNATMPNGQ